MQNIYLHMPYAAPMGEHTSLRIEQSTRNRLRGAEGRVQERNRTFSVTSDSALNVVLDVFEACYDEWLSSQPAQRTASATAAPEVGEATS